MGRLSQLSHPLVAHHLATMRDEKTSPAEFRATVNRLAMLLGVYATADLPTEPITVKTPLADCPSQKLSVRVGLVPILRAGLGLVEPLHQLIPDAEVWHLGMYRNEETAEPVSYYDKLPKRGAVDVGLVLDPMLATGGSIRSAVERLIRWGVPDIRVLSVIAAQPGLDRVQAEFPNVSIFVCAVDPSLNERQFIVPGLGDAGDRIFNTLE
ncbi:Uracil phosphoribosyltransferase [Rosistilla carotiformis]|uniref:Uracil phosphoribosyltransferase n=1 Tax=Rosistilla carotiformis TaxID=2528017 RepID=A0A518JR03_9BACT|nr:uracil phosphoribosyltransferase [Rosistilla carotiformis]QDV67975.1 Uracil phosphoribosyltransferase [Rosistilla carotiformis]